MSSSTDPPKESVQASATGPAVFPTLQSQLQDLVQQSADSPTDEILQILEPDSGPTLIRVHPAARADYFLGVHKGDKIVIANPPNEKQRINPRACPYDAVTTVHVALDARDGIVDASAIEEAENALSHVEQGNYVGLATTVTTVSHE